MTTKKIVVVEDDPDIQIILKAGFRDLPATVTLAGCLADARAIFRNGLPDLILLDMRLPDGSGASLLKELRPDGKSTSGQPGHVPVIVFSAYAQAEDIEAGILSGADGYVTKPFDIFKLRDQVKGLLGV